MNNKLEIKDGWIVQEKIPSSLLLQFSKYKKIAKIRDMCMAEKMIEKYNNSL